MIYQKTALGQKELNGEQRSLGFRQRQVLIMIDGNRSLDELIESFGQLNVKEIISELETNGYIQTNRLIESFNKPENAVVTNRETPATKPEPSPAKPSTSVNIDNTLTELTANQVMIIKNIMSSSTDQFLGMMGKQLKAKIDAAETYAQIKACISQWHMAIRESRNGRDSAKFLMEQVQQTLENKTIDAQMLTKQSSTSH